MTDLPVDVWDRVMSVNARGVLRECRIARFSKSNFAASGKCAASLNCGIRAVRESVAIGCLWRSRFWPLIEGPTDQGCFIKITRKIRSSEVF